MHFVSWVPDTAQLCGLAGKNSVALAGFIRFYTSTTMCRDHDSVLSILSHSQQLEEWEPKKGTEGGKEGGTEADGEMDGGMDGGREGATFRTTPCELTSRRRKRCKEQKRQEARGIARDTSITRSQATLHTANTKGLRPCRRPLQWATGPQRANREPTQGPSGPPPWDFRVWVKYL